jgi:hypothetical protein
VDAHGGVNAEAAGALPGEHVVYGVLIEEAAALEEAEDAALEDGRKGARVVGGEVRGLVEAHLGALVRTYGPARCRRPPPSSNKAALGHMYELLRGAGRVRFYLPAGFSLTPAAPDVS